MPYANNSDLPAPVRHHLPQGAQTIYREAFNGAWHQYANNERQEEIAHRVAWSAVKKRYRKAGEMWALLEPATPARARRAHHG